MGSLIDTMNVTIATTTAAIALSVLTSSFTAAGECEQMTQPALYGFTENVVYTNNDHRPNQTRPIVYNQTPVIHTAAAPIGCKEQTTLWGSIVNWFRSFNEKVRSH